MRRPILVFQNEKIAQQVAQELQAGDIQGAVGAVGDKTKTVYSIEVDEPNHRAALELVGRSEAAAGAIRCPGCNSLNVEFPARPRASGLVSAVSALADAVAPPKVQKFHCVHCKNEWV